MSKFFSKALAASNILPDPLGVKGDIVLLIGKIIVALQKLAIPVVAVMILYGAYKIMTAAENPDRVKEGKWVILYAVIGYAIILMAGGLISIIGDALGIRS